MTFCPPDNKMLSKKCPIRNAARQG